MITTPIYGFIRPDSSDYADQLGDDMGATVDTLEAVLAGLGVPAPPGTAPLAAEVTARAAADTALGNRATALETLTNPSPATGTSPFPYAANFTDYTAAPWSGLRYWRRGGVVTLSGPIKAAAATAAGALVGTLPAGFRPPITMQVVSVTSGTTFYLAPDGTLTSQVALGINAVVMIPPVSFGATQ